MSSIKWNGREVQDPVARVVLGTVLVLFTGIVALIGAIVVAIGFVFIVVTAPVWWLTHVALVRMGRRGFIQRERDGSLHVDISTDGFRKVTTR